MLTYLRSRRVISDLFNHREGGLGMEYQILQHVAKLMGLYECQVGTS